MPSQPSFHQTRSLPNKEILVHNDVACASRLIILVRKDLLTTLAASHSVLLLLAEFGGRELLLLLGSLDLVALSRC